VEGAHDRRRTVTASAPVRICDLGGWTDTWFAGHGAVLNMAVAPRIEARVSVRPADEALARVGIVAANFDESYRYDPAEPPGRQPLLEAAIAELGVPEGAALDLTVASEVPPGSATGTSAATAVAVLGALDALSPGRMAPREVARRAHRLEVDRLGMEAGVQDQIAAALGGVNFIEVGPYPDARVSPLDLAAGLWAELDRRLVLVSLGQAHASSAAHERVLARLGLPGGTSPALDALRRAAEQGRAALVAGDLGALGRAMAVNTEAQRDLDPDLVSAVADDMVQLARAHGAVGWKVNGAGGEGGSMTLLCGPLPSARRALLDAVPEVAGCRTIPVRLTREGLSVTEGPGQAPSTPPGGGR
jgi:D-glycero-alpha-D-manno-heptose-7-phosphate kinase